MAKVEVKEPIVQEISDKFSGAQAVVVVDHRGLTVAQDTDLRKQFRDEGISYKVYKNTLVKRAVKGTEFESLTDILEGPSAFAVSKEDATAPARIIAEFAKKSPKLEFKAGVIEGTFFDADGMQQVAQIPNREILLARLFGSMQAPIANLARVLNQIAEKDGAPADEAPAKEAPAETV